MKTLHFRSVLPLLLSLALTGCGDDGPTGLPSGGSLSMTVDGVPWTATSVSAQRSSGFVGIGAVEEATIIGFGLGFEDLGTGTYEVGGADVANNFTYSVGGDGWGASTFQGGSGTIVVTTLTADRVAGTFSGELPAQLGNASGSVVITNGVFDIPF